MRPARGLSLLLCLFGCSSSPRSSDGAGDKSQPEVEPEPATPCEDDDDCLLSCVEAGNCCGDPPFCTKARHWDDHAAIEATRADCSNFDFNSCPTWDHTVPEKAAIPVCKRKRCEVEFIEREPPPPTIDLSGYDRSCTKDEDCALVHDQPCVKCSCPDNALNVKAVDRAWQAIMAVSCPPYDPWPNVDCGACQPLEAYCEAGQCKAR
jgi:hypothetical protein